MLEGVPHQNGVKMLRRVLQYLGQKTIARLERSLRGVGIALPKDGVQAPQHIFKRQSVAEVGNVVDVGLGELTEIEHPQPRLVAEQGGLLTVTK